MLTYPSINPVAFHIGSWPVYWYGLMYLIAFIIAWGLLSFRIKYSSSSRFNQDQLSDIIFYTALGVIIGGRLGYVIFYDGRLFLAEPLLIFQTWKGGMSFHGGLIGVILALWWLSYRWKTSLREVTDFIAPVVPIGLALGRIGNFINSELWGRVVQHPLPWSMVFPNGGPFPRHPSQIYEFFLEGILLFIVLWVYSRKPKPLGAVSGLFLLGYGIVRIFVEFFRQPDQQIGFLFNGMMTEGQLLSLPMIIFGGFLLIWAYQKNEKR